MGIEKTTISSIHYVAINLFFAIAWIPLKSKSSNHQAGHYADLADMTAALFESLIMNHPFVDGNRRVAFFASDVFLRLNGYRLHVDANHAHRFLIGLLESNRCMFDELLPWIREHVTKA